MLTVVALGGNALLERNDRPDAAIQRHHIQRAATALAPLGAEDQLLVCHGNGPQIGLLAMESQDDPALTKAYPLDALGAQTQGMIGVKTRGMGMGTGIVDAAGSVTSRRMRRILKSTPSSSTATASHRLTETLMPALDWKSVAFV